MKKADKEQRRASEGVIIYEQAASPHWLQSALLTPWCDAADLHCLLVRYMDMDMEIRRTAPRNRDFWLHV
jgi:hypothetical protein